MAIFKCMDYLTCLNKIKRTGKCKSCNKDVGWSERAVSSHKRFSCRNASIEEKRLFSKRGFENSEPSDNFEAKHSKKTKLENFDKMNKNWGKSSCY